MATRTCGLLAYAAAAVAGIAGVGSLSLFGLFLWTGAFGIVDMRLPEHAALRWDAGLCFLFFFQHSGMVRKSFRARLTRVLAEYCHGLVYTIASSLVLRLLVAYWQPSATNVYVLEGPARWLMRGILLLSLAAVLWGWFSTPCLRRGSYSAQSSKSATCWRSLGGGIWEGWPDSRTANQSGGQQAAWLLG